MRPAMEREQRVLRCRGEVDVAHDHHAAVASIHNGFVKKRCAEQTSDKWLEGKVDGWGLQDRPVCVRVRGGLWVV